MALKQLLSAGIMVGVFSLTTIGSEPVLASDKTKEDKRAEGKTDAVVAKEKPRKEEKPSPWENRPMIPAGPKF